MRRPDSMEYAEFVALDVCLEMAELEPPFDEEPDQDADESGHRSARRRRRDDDFEPDPPDSSGFSDGPWGA